MVVCPAGVMSHYTLASSSTTGPGSPPGSTGGPSGTAGLLSPEQRLILQLEQTNNSPAVSSSMSAFALFPGVTSAQQAMPASAALDLSGALDFSQGAGGFRAAGSWLGFGGPVPLSTLDVRGCSAIEALVLAVSWLGQLVVAVGAGQAPACGRLRVETGSFGPMDHVQALNLRLCYPVSGESGAAAQNRAAVAADAPGGADSAAGVGAARGDTPAGSEEDVAGTAVAAVPVSTDAAAAPGSNPRAGNISLQQPADSATAASATLSLHPSPLAVPGWNLSVHTVVLALLSGQLGVMLDCKEPIDLLTAFKDAGRLPLGLVCLSSLPHSLPEEVQGGGVELDVIAVSAVVTSMLSATLGQQGGS